MQAAAEVRAPGVTALMSEGGAALALILGDGIPAVVDEGAFFLALWSEGGGGFENAAGHMVVSVFGDYCIITLTEEGDKAILGVPGVAFLAVVHEVTIAIVETGGGGPGGGDGLILIEGIWGVAAGGGRWVACATGEAVADTIVEVAAVLELVAVVGADDFAIFIKGPSFGADGRSSEGAVGGEALADAVDSVASRGERAVGDAGERSVCAIGAEVGFTLEDVAVGFPSIGDLVGGAGEGVGEV